MSGSFIPGDDLGTSADTPISSRLPALCPKPVLISISFDTLLRLPSRALAVTRPHTPLTASPPLPLTCSLSPSPSPIPLTHGLWGSAPRPPKVFSKGLLWRFETNRGRAGKACLLVTVRVERTRGLGGSSLCMSHTEPKLGVASHPQEQSLCSDERPCAVGEWCWAPELRDLGGHRSRGRDSDPGPGASGGGRGDCAAKDKEAVALKVTGVPAHTFTASGRRVA